MMNCKDTKLEGLYGLLSQLNFVVVLIQNFVANAAMSTLTYNLHFQEIVENLLESNLLTYMLEALGG